MIFHCQLLLFGNLYLIIKILLIVFRKTQV